jgi:hypothetical protein
LTASAGREDTLLYKMASPPRRRVVAAPARRPPAELQAVRVIFEPDPEPDTSYLEQDEFADRRAEHEQGEWHLVGCRAEAEVVIAPETTVQTLRSGGLYGIESDSEQEYLDEVVHGEWSRLRDVLKTVGVPTDQLPLEVDRSWVEWRA